MRAFPLFAAFAVGTCLYASDTASIPTFNRDVAPLLQKHCQECHRPGEAGPMSLLTYKQVRPFSAAIKEAVALRKMPPWYADAHFGKFSNDRSLSQEDIKTIVNWVNDGSPEGNPADLPEPASFVDGWNIGKPDLVFEMPTTFNVPATGTLEYQYILIPLNFKEDTWVQMSEVRPGDRAVVHHVIAWIRPPGSKWMQGLQSGVAFVPENNREANKSRDAGFLAGYAPGMPPDILPNGRAKLIKAGSDIVLEMHYTTNGKPAVDKTKVGLTFPKADVNERVVTLAASNGDFAIPPGDSNYQVDAEFEFGADTKVINFMPHMHLRGKDFQFVANYPTGESQTLLRVPNYSFSWQLVYYADSDVVMPKGTKLHCTAHFDNSANNPANPDPTKTIHWGEQSWDEMMIGFFDVAIPKDMSPSKIFAKPKKTETAAVPTKKAAL